MIPLPEHWKIEDCPGHTIDGDRNTCTHEHLPGVLYRHEDERQVGDVLVAPTAGIPPDGFNEWYAAHSRALIPAEDEIKMLMALAWGAGYHHGQSRFRVR